MSGYQEFSEFYDLLMQDVDYAARADYLCGDAHSGGILGHVPEHHRACGDL